MRSLRAENLAFRCVTLPLGDLLYQYVILRGMSRSQGIVGYLEATVSFRSGRLFLIRRRGPVPILLRPGRLWFLFASLGRVW